jgi:hypothetical protein
VTPAAVAKRRHARDRRLAVVLFNRPGGPRGRGQRDVPENRAERTLAPVSVLLVRSRSSSPDQALPDATVVRARTVEEDDCKSSIPGTRRFATLLPADRMCK